MRIRKCPGSFICSLFLLGLGVGITLAISAGPATGQGAARRARGRRSPNWLMDLADHVTLTGVKQRLRGYDLWYLNRFLSIPDKEPHIVSALVETLFQAVDPTRQSPDLEKMKSLLDSEKEITAALFLLDALYDERGWQKPIPEESKVNLLPMVRELGAIKQSGMELGERDRAIRRVLSTTLHEPLLSKVALYLLISAEQGAVQEGIPPAMVQYISSDLRLRRHGIRLLTLEAKRFGVHREAHLRSFLAGMNVALAGDDLSLAMRATAAVVTREDQLEKMGSRTFQRKKFEDVTEFTDDTKEWIRSLGKDPEKARTTLVDVPTDPEAHDLFQRCKVRVGFRTAEDRLAYVMECVRKGLFPAFTEALLLGSRHFPETLLLKSLDVLATTSDGDKRIGKTQTVLMEAGKYISPEHELYPKIVARILAMVKKRSFSSRAILADTIAAMGCPAPFVLPLLSIYKDSPDSAGYRKYVVGSHVVESFRKMPRERLVKAFRSILDNPELEPYHGTVWTLGDAFKIEHPELQD